MSEHIGSYIGGAGQQVGVAGGQDEAAAGRHHQSADDPGADGGPVSYTHL